MLNIVKGFPFQRLEEVSEPSKIFGIFDHYKDVIGKLAIEQSGGMGFANFDAEIETLFYQWALQTVNRTFRF